MIELPHEYPLATWQAWCDGSAAPNPGKIGVGIVLISPDGIRMEKSLAIGHSGCNNQAELHALALVLDMARAAGSNAIHICTDSKAAADWIIGNDSTSVQPLATLVADIQLQLRSFDFASLAWIPRHRNKEADQLSRRALGLSETVLPKRTKHRKQFR